MLLFWFNCASVLVQVDLVSKRYLFLIENSKIIKRVEWLKKINGEKYFQVTLFLLILRSLCFFPQKNVIDAPKYQLDPIWIISIQPEPCLNPLT